MKTRLDLQKQNPKVVQLLLGIEGYLINCGLEHRLMLLVKMRASQLNGCAHCIDMHSQDARAEGESEQRLYALDAWRETPFYTDRERAALEWTEALTFVSDGHVPDAVYESVRPHFTAAELVNLTLAVTNINAWNRFAIAFRAPSGTYKPGMHAVSRGAG
jgi:AhpD family alkylhydroperoxidase